VIIGVYKFECLKLRLLEKTLIFENIKFSDFCAEKKGVKEKFLSCIWLQRGLENAVEL